jgi:hypothetical protein
LGVMERLVLSDVAWERMAPLIKGRPDQKGSTGRDKGDATDVTLGIGRSKPLTAAPYGVANHLAQLSRLLGRTYAPNSASGVPV